MRLDKYILEKLKSIAISRNMVIQAIKKGRILVNSQKSKPSDQVFIPSNIDESEVTIPTGISINKLPFIYKNLYWGILNKPVGIPVHKGVDTSILLIKLLREYFGQKVYLVHRLDKDTSEGIFISFSKKMQYLLSDLFEKRRIEKYYLGIVDLTNVRKDILDKKNGSFIYVSSFDNIVSDLMQISHKTFNISSKSSLFTKGYIQKKIENILYLQNEELMNTLN